MRNIDVREVTKIVADLCIKSNVFLPQDIKYLLNKLLIKENSKEAKNVIELLIENYQYAEYKRIPICQDTGLAIIFLNIGQDVSFIGGSLMEAINAGVSEGYINGYLRCSVVSDPIYHRVNTGNNTPAIVYTNIVEGENVEIIVSPKGFGSENMSKMKMMLPSDSENDIIEYVVDVVKLAGSNCCPPLIVGVGIGGSFEYCAYLAKKALCRSTYKRNNDVRYADLEIKILNEINNLNIGPQGLGGITALAVNIEWYPTHIASLPVAVNIGCHATRHMSAII